uniref:NADH dehydrogenase subunit 1 n=1 Tax=Chortoglyphus arcuatus TaxID=66564 RepID=UPI0021FD26A9|nr:NADH dehydrogenase subunit 1 [Chortoglyphus arcuatus]UBQ34118.1 NADH dehydrogenase subunit 1 [Chortoglyphus arcuatus]
MIFLTDFLFSMVGVLLSVAFFTLMERKFMGLMHFRKGPNKTIPWGVSQPISDALKLLTKEFPKFQSNKMIMFFMGPVISIIIMLLCWGWFNYHSSINSSNLKMMMILSLMSLTAYGLLFCSWGSNSKYSILGGHRAVAQIISYEVCLVMFTLIVIYINKSYNMKMMMMMQENMWMGVFSIPLLLCWMIICMAESNRTPFDMAEGESEIVSGFNIEYGGGLFALIFISEYGMIMFLSFISVLLFLGSTLIMFKTFLICFMFVWVRCSFPRVRYDYLMMLCWKMILPYSIALTMLSCCLL